MLIETHKKFGQMIKMYAPPGDMFSIFEVGWVEPSKFHPSQGTKIHFQPIIEIKSYIEKE